MRLEINDPVALRQLPWRDLKAYLDAAGWHQDGQIGDRAMVYVPPSGTNEAVEILVPARDDIADYVSRIAEAIHLLADLEQRSALVVYEDIAQSGLDLVRLFAPSADARGAISLEDGVTLHQEAENLMLAAACAAVEPRRSYHLRKVTEATQYLKSVRLAPASSGSFIVTVFSPVQPRLVQGTQQPLDLGDEPFARAVTLRLADALGEVGRAANRALADGAVDPFEAAVALGVSANLCEAVAGLVGSAGGIEIGLTWARTRPAGRAHQRYRFSLEQAEVLREAAAIFRRAEPRTDTHLIGFVIALDRPLEQFDGNATLRVVIDDKPRRLRVRFEQALYPAVIRAFQDKLAVSLLGDLFRVGGRWELRSPREVHILEDQEDEAAGDWNNATGGDRADRE
jgi:hypothetical protein